MSDFLTCWESRSVVDSLMGPAVTGPNITAYWISDIYRAYYTTGCLAVMALAFGFSNPRAPVNLKSAKFWLWFTFYMWIWTIFILYVNFVIGGVTRVTMIIGVVHNIAEVFNGFSIFATIAPNLFRKSKIQPFFLSIPLIIYVLVELLAVIFAPLEEGYLWLVVMGFIADVWNWVWLGIGRYKRTLTTYPFISCSFHMLYTVFIAFNCGFAPWGRFLGLLWNTFAVVIFCIGTRFWPYELFYGENVRGVDGDDRNETNQKSASSNDNNIALTEKSSTTTTTTTAPSTESDQKSV